MFVRDNIIVVFLSSYKVYDIISSEILFNGGNGFEYGKQSILSFDFLLRMHTIVTTATIILLVHFAKIMEQHLSPTNRRFGIGCRFLQQLPTDILF